MNLRLSNFLAASVLLVPVVATAGRPGDDAARITVRVADLNLRSEAGMQRLYARLNRAAEIVCGEADSRDLDRLVVSRRCVQQTLDRAVESVGWARLSDLHRRHLTRVAG